MILQVHDRPLPERIVPHQLHRNVVLAPTPSPSPRDGVNALVPTLRRIHLQPSRTAFYILILCVSSGGCELRKPLRRWVVGDEGKVALDVDHGVPKSVPDTSSVGVGDVAQAGDVRGLIRVDGLARGEFREVCGPPSI